MQQLAILLKAVKAFTNRHLLLLASLVSFVGIFFLVPQVNLLAKDLLGQWDTFFRLGILTVMLVVWLIGTLLHFVALTLDDDRRRWWSSWIPQKLLRVLGPVNRKLVVWPLGLFYRSAAKFRRASRAWWGYVLSLILITIGVFLAYLFPIRMWPDSILETAWPLWGGFIRILAALGVAVSSWLLFGRFYGPNVVLDDNASESGSDTERRQRVWRRSGEVLSGLFWLAVVLESVWIAAEHRLLGISLSLYSVWAYFAIASGVCMLASWIDFLDRNTAFFWRYASVGVLIVLASIEGPVTLPSEDAFVETEPLAISTESSEGNEEAVTQSSVDANRSDVWINAAIERLERRPDGPAIIVTASGGGSRAALAAVISLEEIQSLFGTDERPACIWLCSGVSGGGIALASYYYPGRSNVSARNAVSMDFLAPMYRGLLVPNQNRGESLTAFWDRYFQWDQIKQSALNVDRPLLVFGASDIDIGRRVMIGFPQLPGGWFPRWTRKNGEWTVSNENYSPYSLSTLRLSGSPLDVSMTRAVRMSSSFPFGFEPTLARVDQPDGQGNEPVDIHFLDGGMIDNTGLDSVVAIMKAVAESGETKADQLRTFLRRRGVLLIEIDAGARPGQAASSGLFLRVKEPITGYNRGVYTSALRAKDDNIHQIESFVGSDRFAYEPIELIPQDENVSEIMTTLSLPANDIKRVRDAYSNRQSAIRKALIEKYDAVRALK